MENEVLDEDEDIKKEILLREALVWWERKRIYFNVIVGFSGIIAIFSFYRYFFVLDIIGIIMWGLMANLFYSVGFLLEALSLHYFKSKLPLDRLRMVLFILGTVSVALITYIFAFLYFYWI